MSEINRKLKTETEILHKLAQSRVIFACLSITNLRAKLRQTTVCKTLLIVVCKFLAFIFFNFVLKIQHKRKGCIVVVKSLS